MSHLDGLQAVGVDGAGVGDEAGDKLAAVAVDEVVDCNTPCFCSVVICANDPLNTSLITLEES
jgi:hypothetical protein